MERMPTVGDSMRRAFLMNAVRDRPVSASRSKSSSQNGAEEAAGGDVMNRRRSFAIEAHLLDARRPGDLAPVFDTATRQRA